MSFESWAAFAAAAAVLVAVPGPTILLVVSYALGQGWRAALPMAVGVALGDFTAMTLSMLGIGALLLASATVFTVLKWIGAAYLIYLGIKLFRAGGTLVSIVGPPSARPADGLAVDFVVESDRAQLSEIVQRVRDGRLRTNIGNVSPLDDAVAAFNRTERVKGKPIIRVHP